MSLAPVSSVPLQHISIIQLTHGAANRDPREQTDRLAGKAAGIQDKQHVFSLFIADEARGSYHLFPNGSQGADESPGRRRSRQGTSRCSSKSPVELPWGGSRMGVRGAQLCLQTGRRCQSGSHPMVYNQQLPRLDRLPRYACGPDRRVNGGLRVHSIPPAISQRRHCNRHYNK